MCVKYAHPLVLSALPQEIAMLAQNVQLDIIWIKTNVLPNVQLDSIDKIIQWEYVFHAKMRIRIS